PGCLPARAGGRRRPHRRLHLLADRGGRRRLRGQRDRPRRRRPGEVVLRGTTHAARVPGQPMSQGERARKMVAEGAVLLDVRTPREFSAGHLEGALNIPVQELAFRMGDLPEGKPVVVYCHMGPRSAVAAAMMRARGIEVLDIGTMAAYQS